MISFHTSFPLVLLSLILISAQPPTSPDGLIRQANEAFLREAFDLAEQLYGQAEERTTDPGLVAFNKGLVLYQREKYRDAEVHFRRTLEDRLIPHERQSRAWYNLGNCLLKQAGEENVKQLRSAIACFENALESEGINERLAADARYHLELSKMLWAKANAKQSQQNTPNEDPPEQDHTPKKSSDTKEDQPKDDKEKNAKTGKEKEPKMESVEKKKEMKAKEIESPKKSPGVGTLPVLADDSEVHALSPEDTRALLQRIEDRLAKERINLRREASSGNRERDW